MEEIERNLRINSLFDRYGLLLSKTQQKMIKMYYQEDLSLGEIAEIEKISRNAVYDSIKKGTNILENYEKQMKLIEKEDFINSKIEEALSKNINEEVKDILLDIKERVNE